MTDKWREIWNKRNFNFEILKTKDKELIFRELKRADGFDVVHKGLSVASLIKQFEDTKNQFANAFEDRDFSHANSLYEVGCGAGANLYMFEQLGLKVGGIDYSKALCDIARTILKSSDIICAEAIRMPSADAGIYDFVLSNSVFSYFPDFLYAQSVLEKMYEKCKYAIGIIDIHDKEKEQAFIDYRIKTVPNYKERYKDLKKLFYDKDFFINFAQKHRMKILFSKSEVEGYWNNDFVFSCFLYKN